MPSNGEKNRAMQIEAMAEAIEIVGQGANLARRLKVKPPTVAQWKNGDRPVPALRAIEIERITSGKVLREKLCPKFPWESLSSAS